MSVIVGLLSGLMFGLGLIVAGMVDPAKVLGFLDLGGAWDPSLAFVMAGAIAVGLPAFTLARRRRETFLGLQMQLPTSQLLDRRLVLGSVMFGVGWGLAGLCPGPALVVAGVGAPKALVFVGAMLAGMGVFEWLEARRG
ncbi:DUF6691 family protein [Roseateles sp. BYS87W]|uniref:DUF6691 family protein n=1 Tax=Pelomonas baiyunensis TaxID=3299026 RepID=A0ABW7GXC9_9BURK